MNTDLDQVPVTVLTGYLGAGKTTLLNRILTEDHGKKYAVIVNEFGEIGIDNELIVDSDEEIFEMNNGCICCTVRGDLIRIIEGLMKRRNRFDGIIVETTGLAYPGPVAQTFFVDEDVRSKTKLDAIVSVVDAKHFLSEIDHAKEIVEQIAFADVVLVNKADLVSDAELQSVEGRIRKINPLAKLIRSTRCSVDSNRILDQNAFNLQRILEIDEDFLDEDDDHHDHAGHHDHDQHEEHGRTSDHEVHSDKKGEHLAEHSAGHHHHEHDEHVQSLSLQSETPLDPDRFFPWIQDLVQRFGADLLRMKGVLSFRRDDNRFVVQAVHMLMEGDKQRPWRKDEKRVSKIVFIGRDLPFDVIRAGFEKCALNA
jgi:G3E family GTPase